MHHDPSHSGDHMQDLVVVSDTLECRAEGQAEVDTLGHTGPVPGHTVPEAGIQLVAHGGGIHTLTAPSGDRQIPVREAVQAGMPDYTIPHSQPAVVVVVPAQSGTVRHRHHRQHHKQVADMQEVDTAPEAATLVGTHTHHGHSHMRLGCRHPKEEGVDTTAVAVEPHMLVELHTPDDHRSGCLDARSNLHFLDTAHNRALRGTPSRARGSGAYLSHAHQV